MDEQEELYREMNPEDGFYMGGGNSGCGPNGCVGVIGTIIIVIIISLLF
ncbi:MAG: hypothetical protein R3Y50_05295 [Rikenellaceae bacterium]